MHTTSQLILQESLFSDVLNVLERFGIMTDTQAIDVVTFDFKGTRVRCFSAALLIIKWITLRCKSFLNDQSL